MPDVISEAKVCLDQVLENYASRGVSISRIPDIIYRPAKQDNYLAYVAGEFEHTATFLRELAFATGHLIWKKPYGLSVSRDALEEFASKFNEIAVTNRIDEALESNTIYLGLRFAKQNPASKKAMLAHELWHLTEQQEGCFSTFPFITEGTATYAESFFRPAEFLNTRIYSEEITDITYRITAKFVKHHMVSNNLPLADLLKNDVRDKINTSFSDVFVKSCVDAQLAEAKTEEGMRKAKDTLVRIGFNTFDGTLDVPKLLTVYRNFGLVKLADELATQDLSLLLADYKKMGL